MHEPARTRRSSGARPSRTCKRTRGARHQRASERVSVSGSRGRRATGARGRPALAHSRGAADSVSPALVKARGSSFTSARLRQYAALKTSATPKSRMGASLWR